MSFPGLIGHAPIGQLLTRLLNHQLPPLLLFSGPDGVGKILFARAFAERLLGDRKEIVPPLIPVSETSRSRENVEISSLRSFRSSSIDLHIYQPEGKTGMHSINSMRQFAEDVYLKPYQARYKVFIFEEAHRMLPIAANALLKTFEEPAEDSLIILVSHLPALLLPTIRSRSQTIRFGTLTVEEMTPFIAETWQQPQETARQLAAKARGSLGRVGQLLAGETEQKRQLLLQLLAKPRPLSFLDIKQFAVQIGAKWEERRKECEKAFEQQIKKHFADELSAVQRETLRQEAEGSISLIYREEVQQLFAELLGWYRDLQLLKVNGGRSRLFHPDWLESLDQALQRGELLPLEQVQEAIIAAHLALERHTPASFFLESLLLKMG